MKKAILTFVIIGTTILSSFAQDKVSNSGDLVFQSLVKKDVKATCLSFTSKLNLPKKSIVISVPIQGFEFKKTAMQKKFNGESVMNSQAYPKAKFKGTIDSNEDITKSGTYNVTIKGTMTIKGITKDFIAKGKIDISQNKILVSSTFIIHGSDFGIDMKYGKEMEVKISIQY